MVGQHRAHLTELDAISADLDLIISTAHIGQLPISTPTHQIPGAIHPLPRGSERARHKPRRAQPRPSPIPHTHTRTGHIQLTDHPSRSRTQPRIEDKETQMAQRHPDRAHRSPGVIVTDLAVRGMHRGLGGAIQIQQPRDLSMMSQPAVQPRRLQRLPGENHRLQHQLLPMLRTQRLSGLQRIKGRRGLTEHTDTLGDQQVQKLIRRTRRAFGHHHQPAPTKQRTPNLIHRNVKGIRMPLTPYPTPVHIGIQGRQQLHNVAVGDRHPLGHTGSARRVNQIGDFIAPRGRHPRTRMGPQRRILDIDDYQAMPGQPPSKPGSTERQPRRGIGEHELDARIGHRRIDRHIGRPRLEHCQDRHDRLDRTRNQQRHTLPRSGPVPDQQMRQPIRGLIQLPIGHRSALESDRYRVRRPTHLLGEQHGNRRRGPTQRRGQHPLIAPPLQQDVLSTIQHINGGKPPPRISGDRRQHPLHTPDQRLNTDRIEHIGAELHRPTNTGRLTTLTKPLGQRKRQIHPSGLRIHLHRRDTYISIRARNRVPAMNRQVLPGQQHLHQRMMSQASSRIKPIHQHLERHILMLKCLHAAATDLRQHLSHTGITGQIRPQHQCVDEQPHQVIQSRITPPGDREPHRHIRTGAQLGQHHRQCRLYHHERGRVMLTSHPRHLLLQPHRPIQAHTGTAVISDRRIRPIGGQLQPLRQPRQHLLPMAHLRRNTTIGITQLTELLTLPQRVIGILHRQRRPPRRTTRPTSPIRGDQITYQRRDRPPISSDMMHHRRQYKFIPAELEKRCPQGNLRSQVKAIPHRGTDGLLQPLLRPTLGVNNPPPEIRLLSRHNHLSRHPLGRHEHRAQTLLTPDDVSQRRTHSVDIQPSADAEHGRQVVHRRRPMQLMQEPQPLLGE
nr:hypothetical protein CPGR_04925 [Mycolicibacterium malmesburyense]